MCILSNDNRVTQFHPHIAPRHVQPLPRVIPVCVQVTHMPTSRPDCRRGYRLANGKFINMHASPNPPRNLGGIKNEHLLENPVQSTAVVLFFEEDMKSQHPYLHRCIKCISFIYLPCYAFLGTQMAEGKTKG